MRAAILLAAVAAAACSKAPPAGTRAAPDAAPAVAAPPRADAAPAVDAGLDCFAQCMRDNQMRAVSIDQIERDCRAQCSAAPGAP